MIDAAPRHVGDVQQTVDAAEIDERAVVGDVLDEAVDDLALLEPGDDVGALLGARLFEHRPARHDDIAAPAIHLQDLERLLLVHQRPDVAHRADVDLASGKNATAPSRSTVKHGCVTLFIVTETVSPGAGKELPLPITPPSVTELVPAVIDCDWVSPLNATVTAWTVTLAIERTC